MGCCEFPDHIMGKQFYSASTADGTLVFDSHTLGNESSSFQLLTKLLDMGFSWTHIAQMMNVKVHVVRVLDYCNDFSKMLSEESHSNLARLHALVDMLKEKLPNQDVAAWLETTLDGYYYSGIDVISKGQTKLLIKYADGEVSSTELLDSCFPNWRDNYDDRIEIFTASDGERAIRLRDDTLED